MIIDTLRPVELDRYPRLPTEEDMRYIISNPRVAEICRETGEQPLYESDQTAAQVTIGDWFLYKLRDRRQDGPLSSQTLLTQWSYKHPDDTCFDGPAIEESTYWLDPRTKITEKFNTEDARFIINPFKELPINDPSSRNLEEWLETWEKLMENPYLVYPGQYAFENIPGLRRQILDRSKDVLQQEGYKYLDAIPTWIHNAGQYEHLGFSFLYDRDRESVGRLAKSLPVEDRDSRIIISWIVVRQFWAALAQQQGLKPEEFVADDYILRDEDGALLLYPLTPERNLWMRTKTL